ncbi:MAG: PAS domain-containing protein, partial [Endomicrobium sp.]|nr:PAS domain-containing protein [Endomicrobium sp.]
MKWSKEGQEFLRLAEEKDQTIKFSDSMGIESTVAMFRNCSPEKPMSNAVVYFWESHNKNSDERSKIQATVDLIDKEFDLSTCEKYEVRTGYLSRYNYMPKPFKDCTDSEIKAAIIRGKELEGEWINRCHPELPGFVQKKWEECIFEENNPYHKDCKSLVIQKKSNNSDFIIAFEKSFRDYAEKHGTDQTNGELYILEEISWILSLPLLHINKSIYLIHVGSDNPAIKALFHNFPNLQKAVKWLSPHFSTSKFQSVSEFLLDYRNAVHVGHSYAIENKDSVKHIKQFKPEKSMNNMMYLLECAYTENNLLRTLIENLPGHVYWLNSENIYLGCNGLQAKDFGLKSCKEIVGKTNSDLLSSDEAKVLDKINLRIIETGEPYEGEELADFYRREIGNYLSQKTPLFDHSGKIIGLLGISIDITDRKKVEGLEIENRLQKSNKILAEQIAHDIRSPLASL